MKRIKVAIVDDEILARNRIKKLLSQDSELHVVADFAEGKDAIQFVESHHVDILYLDIHMPEIDGFTVLDKISVRKRPFVIFATADKESAIKAFEHKALDYLLKPFRNQRFYESLENAKNYVRLKESAKLSENILEFAQDFKKEKNKTEAYESDMKIDFDDIIYIQSDRNYLKVYRDHKDYLLIRKSLIELKNELNDENFIQIHRSLIVNKYFIQKIIYSGNNEYRIYLSSGIVVKSSRSYKADIEKLTK